MPQADEALADDDHEYATGTGNGLQDFLLSDPVIMDKESESGEEHIRTCMRQGFVINELSSDLNFDSSASGSSASDEGSNVLLPLAAAYTASGMSSICSLRCQPRTQAIRGWPGPATDNPPHAKSPVVNNNDHILDSIILIRIS